MKRTKKITQALRAIAKQLPRQEYTFAGRISENGHDIIQRGITKDEDGLPIMPHKSYVKKIPLQRAANHQRRIRSAFDSNGFEGVKAYLKAYIKPELQVEFFTKLQKALV
jgi:hypothetical protein